jgi:D-glycero-D-manno-heptose 1,7-bisphosphate phosphatase
MNPCSCYNIFVLSGIFLDRDGVIIENRTNYVRSWDDVYIYPQALAALIKISKFPQKIIIVTNQSAVGRGIVSYETADAINRRLVAKINKSGGRIDGVYICPHRPDEGCNCRKPHPGLIQQAAIEHSLDLRRSMMIGDAITDLKAGLAAGIQIVVLVKTGRGRQEANLQEASKLGKFQISENLDEAISTLIVNKSIFSGSDV